MVKSKKKLLILESNVKPSVYSNPIYMIYYIHNMYTKINVDNLFKHIAI